MKIAFLGLLCALSSFAVAQKKLLILGSSTSAGYGPANPANWYVNRLKAYYNRFSTTLVIDNRAVGGYNVYKSMPKNSVPPPGRDTVLPYYNITDGLASNPDVILINYPTNGYDVFSAAEVMQCLRTIRQTALAAGKPCYITTTQPRTGFTPDGREKLRVLKDSILAAFGPAAIDFYTGLTDPLSLAIATPYQVNGDPVHLNDSAHALLFKRVVEKKLFPDPAGIGIEYPIANAGTHPTVKLPVNTVTLDGSLSSAPGSLISAYSWTFLSGPAGSVIASPAARSTVVNNLVAGVYHFRLKITNTQGFTAFDDVCVSVTASSSTLTANAGKDETLPVGQATVLHGENSTCLGSGIAAYQWSKFTGPSAYEILNPTAKATWIRSMVAGTYIYRLTVTDSTGKTAFDDVMITVTGPQVTANAGADQVITAPASSVSLDGSKSVASGSTISSYTWNFISGPAGSVIASPNNAVTAINSLVPGKYIFRLTVKNSTAVTATDDVMVTVNPKIETTTMPVANAGNDETIPVGQATVLRGTNSYVSTGSIVSYEWTKYSGPANYEMLSPLARETWVRNMVAGTYIYRLTITDNSGNKAFDDVKITVIAPGIAGAHTRQRSGIIMPETTIDAAAASLLLYPNPVKASANIRLNGAYRGTGVIRIFSASGMLMKQISIRKNENTYNASIPVADLSRGFYHVEVKMGGSPAMLEKLVKE